MIDIEAVLSRVDLLSLVQQRTQLRKVAAREYAGACPRCGGKDRLHVNTDRGWFCRRCQGAERWNDAIEWVRFTTGASFIEAITRLGGKADITPAEMERMCAEREAAEESRMTAERAEREAVHAELTARADWRTYADNLDRYPEARALWHERGLSDEWISYYGLGYSPSREFGYGEDRITSPSLTIPYFRPVFCPDPEGGDAVTWRVVGLQHRLLADNTPGGKYRPHMRGAGKSLFYTDLLARRATGRVLLVEGEIKAMVTWAALWEGYELCYAPDLTVIGTAGAAVKGELLAELERAEHIMVCLDPDAETEAVKLAKMLGEERSRVIRLPGKIDDLIVSGVLDTGMLINLLEG